MSAGDGTSPGRSDRATLRTATTRLRPAPGREAEHANEVRLVGRLASAPVRRVLPSGDELLSFRLVVDRAAGPPGPRRAGRAADGAAPGRVARSPTVDTLDCTAWRKDVQRAVGRAGPGDVLEVRGALRRRFWRSPSGGPASRSEVEVSSARRVRRADG